MGKLYDENVAFYISYLAVVAGNVSEADYIFVPESPPPRDWQKKLCTKLAQARIENRVLRSFVPFFAVNNISYIEAI